MKRYILRLTYDFGDHPVRYLYVHKSGTWYRDTKEIDAATRFYNLGTAEKYEEKVRRNPHYEFYSTSILSFDDEIVGEKLSGKEHLLHNVRR